MPAFTRRRFFSSVAGATALAQASRAQDSAITAREVIERIQTEVGIPWGPDTVDTFKAGDPDTPVRGIATTVMSTFDVLKKSVDQGLNLVITHEPTFYNHRDETADFADDPVYQAKLQFIEDNDLVVWRFHDYWHQVRPEPMRAALAKQTGWEQYPYDQDLRAYKLPGLTLASLAADIKKRMGIRTLRVIGDPDSEIHTAVLAGGFNNPMSTMRRLPRVDLIVVGESREWESVPYAQDTITAGHNKAFIILGHAVSEDPGMELCAAWISRFVSEVPIKFVPAGEPFWTP